MLRTRIGFAAAAVTATVALSLAVNGVATSRLPGNLLDTPAAAADELTPFSGCDELLAWYIRESIDSVGPWGFGPGPILMLEGGYDGGRLRDLAAGPAAAEGRPEGTGSSETGTNVQEAGVDEPDVAKTDGRLVVHVRGSSLVVTDTSDGKAREVGRLRLPRDLVNAELLLSGDRVLVLGSSASRRGVPMPVDAIADRVMPWMTWGSERTRLLTVDLGDPSEPRVVSDQDFGGTPVSARQYGADGTDGGAVLRLVLRTGYPTLDFVQPNRKRTPHQATEENRRIVRESTIEDWLPDLTRGGSRTPLLACTDVRHPDVGSGFGTLSVVTLPFDSPDDLDTVAVTAAGETVYSSTDRLYLATTAGPRKTEVHAFALAGRSTTYVASGEVRGRVRDRWSFDERGGDLRVAVSYGADWATDQSGIEILRERAGGLVTVGSVRGLGPKEEIQSVRWFDDLAVVVTFRQVDPLYTVDLSDATAPRTLGALKIPGFSSYLHPIGEDRLLGLGSAADRRGSVTGGQASTFDLSDLSSPRRLDVLMLGSRVTPMAAWEPRTFTWLGDRATGLAMLENSWTGGTRLVALTVAADGTLTEQRSWPVPGWGSYRARTLPLEDGRVALVTDEVDLIEVG